MPFNAIRRYFTSIFKTEKITIMYHPELPLSQQLLHLQKELSNLQTEKDRIELSIEDAKTEEARLEHDYLKHEVRVALEHFFHTNRGHAKWLELNHRWKMQELECEELPLKLRKVVLEIERLERQVREIEARAAREESENESEMERKEWEAWGVV